MIDLHCHILPGIDDGARDISEAKSMLAMQQASGVNAMYLTPHFYPEEKPLEVFLSEREQAWEKLAAELSTEACSAIRLGAEVRYCEQLLSLDLKALTLGGGDYLLLELPGSRYPAYGVQIMEELMGKGIVPILAHVERYAYFREEPALLKRLTDLGVLAQVSARALFDRRDRNFSLACLQQGLAQIVASDAHNETTRKPNMEILRKLPQELQQLHSAFTSAVWENEMPPYLRANNVKKTFFGYR
jgi:protein-tyrosine phosphatase